MTQNRNVTVDPATGHRIDPLTNIDLDQAIADNNHVALAQVEVAQYEAMAQEFPGWYANDCLKLARRRLARAQATHDRNVK